MFYSVAANYVITVETKLNCTVNVENSVMLEKKTLQFKFILGLLVNPTESRAKVRDQVDMFFRMARFCLTVFETVSIINLRKV